MAEQVEVPDTADTARISAPVRRRKVRRPWPLNLRIGLSALVFVVAVLLLTPWLAPHDPAAQDLANRLAPTGAGHLLGTDHLGRDVLSRLMWGGRFSVSIAAVTLVISAVLGTLLGLVCARVKGALDEFVMRLSDVMLAFPEMIVAMFLVAIVGPGYGTLILALAIGGWTPFARLARGLALEINSRDFIEAADSLGFTRRFIIVRHVLPNALSPLLAHAALRFGHKLITVGALSFLGLGVQPPASDWGGDAGRRSAVHDQCGRSGHLPRPGDLPHRTCGHVHRAGHRDTKARTRT
ncbi:ABC transporter permease [Georgenia sp. SUBG003]|uniref:ABC transporter permease n=1 Tax=Georgenia sp. SUBG003 TaxID=1497974 RepID=UPI003AB8DDE4